MKKVLVAMVLISMAVSSINAQVKKRIYYYDENSVPREHPLDFQHLKLEVSFEPEAGKVIGKVTHDFKVLIHEADTVFLDAPGIKIESISLDGASVEHRKVKDGIVVKFGQKLTSESSHQMVISYTATPKKGIYFIGWNDPTGRSRKQIWTQGQGIDNRHWIPMYDLPNDKVTTEMIVEMKDGYRVLSNGVLLSSKNNKNGSTVWHYKMKKPHSTYLIMLGIGNYEVKNSKSPSGVPMEYWYYPDWEDRVEVTYKFSEDMMSFMEDETGVAYPWPKYAQIPVQDFLYGAMENTSATIYGDFYMVDERTYLDRNYVRVNAHELAHQWFGDLISARTSQHHWLQESFATHYDLSYQKVAFGQDYFDWKRRQAALSALGASLSDLKPLAHSSAGTARHYPKGSYVLQMLRDVAGNENYKKAIQYYLKKHQYGNVDSEDLLVAFHESTGLSLDWFWEEWVYHGGEPHYKVDFETVHVGSKHFARFNVEQIHEVNELTGLFRMPIDFEVHLENGNEVTKRVWVEHQTQVVDIKIPAGNDIKYVLFDAGSKVLKKVTFEKPYDYLLTQAVKAEYMLDRYDAVVGLRSDPISHKRQILQIVLKDESEFFAVRNEALKQLIGDPESLADCQTAFKSKDVDVRKAALNSITVLPESWKADVEMLLDDPSYTVVEKALEILVLNASNSDEVNSYLSKTKGLVGNNERNVEMTWLQIDVYTNHTDESLAKLIDYSSSSFEFRTRVAAAKKLKELDHLDQAFIKNLLDGHFSYNARLRSPMKKILDDYMSTIEGRKMIQHEIAVGDWNDWQQKRIKLLLK